MQYPQSPRSHLLSINLPEGLNNQIETLRRNAGGHFHSQREALIIMKLLTINSMKPDGNIPTPPSRPKPPC